MRPTKTRPPVCGTNYLVPMAFRAAAGQTGDGRGLSAAAARGLFVGGPGQPNYDGGRSNPEAGQPATAERQAVTPNRVRAFLTGNLSRRNPLSCSGQELTRQVNEVAGERSPENGKLGLSVWTRGYPGLYRESTSVYYGTQSQLESTWSSDGRDPKSRFG